MLNKFIPFAFSLSLTILTSSKPFLSDVHIWPSRAPFSPDSNTFFAYASANSGDAFLAFTSGWNKGSPLLILPGTFGTPLIAILAPRMPRIIPLAWRKS